MGISEDIKMKLKVLSLIELSVKKKLLSLIIQSNSVTDKSDTNITDCVSSLIKGYSENRIIPVDEMPTENISVDDIYDVAFVFTDLILSMPAYDIQMSYKELITEEGGTFESYVIPTRTTDSIKISSDDALYCYYIVDENDVGVYRETAEGSGVYEWMMLSEELAFLGFITHPSQATGEGVYGLDGGGYYKYYGGPFLTDIIVAGVSGKNSGDVGQMFYEETRPTSNLVASDSVLNPYYIVDENDIFYSDGTELYSLSVMLTSMTFGGAISDISEATDATKYYAVVSEGGFQRLYPESAIGSLNTPTAEEKTVTPTKSTQTVEPTNADYLSKVTVNPIPSSYIVPSGTVTITENGVHYVPEYAIADVNVQNVSIPDGYILPSGGVTIVGNGEYDVTEYAEVIVNVEPVLQDKTVTQNGTVTPDSGYDGLSSVTVDVNLTVKKYYGDYMNLTEEN